MADLACRSRPCRGLLLLLAGIYSLGAGDFSALGPTLGGVVVASLTGTVLSARRRAQSPESRAAMDRAAARERAILDSPAVRYLDPGFGEAPDVPLWAEPYAAHRSRTFPVPERTLVTLLRNALSRSPHFVLSEVHDGGATVHRRTQLAFHGERFLLEFSAVEEGTEVGVTFRPLSPASIGTASGVSEIERLFRVLAEAVAEHRPGGP
ncbi:hypothetical protein [Naasia aerilata]|uniref:DUF1499 domain-containing protein n=1 Tax=Naasia aerilata TaxID=1162966 RepID=A0ABN6XP27_9MICO|nr:hypothetical protein [Naasia aerilata]BDZ46752.1 hypothetical protein GCM10025866_26610 [Naasia aerilata]